VTKRAEIQEYRRRLGGIHPSITIASETLALPRQYLLFSSLPLEVEM